LIAARQIGRARGGCCSNPALLRHWAATQTRDAPEHIRRNVDVFHPQQDGLAGLSERVRHSFDPRNILNRGRMIRGPAT